MDLNSSQLITRNIVHEIPATDVVIKAVENMAYKQGFKSLKFKNRNGVIYHDADWIAGVDYDDMMKILKVMMNNTPATPGATKPGTNLNNTIDPEEIGNIIQDARQNIDPNLHEENDNANEQQLKHPEEPHETAEDKEPQATEPSRRLTRETRPIERLEPNMSGKPYTQEKKKVIFESDVDVQLEYCQSLVTQTKPNESQTKEYSPSDAMLIARLIYDLNTRIVREGASFSQQYLLNKGLKIFGQKG
jgi:hypothetical protein